jgi:uncharacterized protein (TIGR03083 family)
LGERILAAARVRRAPAAEVPGYASPYAAQVCVLDALLAELTDLEWGTIVIYDWNVQDLLAHLTATDGLLADQIPEPSRRPNGEINVDARTAELIASERGRPPAATRTRWRRQADTLCARLRGSSPDQRVVLRGRMRLQNAIVARAFETWIHSADIASAVGRTLPAPLPEHLHAIADLGVRALPAALAMRSPGGAEGSARVVLDGPGGGDWLVKLGAADDLLVTLELDVLEFCFLAADRRDPGEIQAAIDGDAPLGRRLLASASAFAGP